MQQMRPETNTNRTEQTSSEQRLLVSNQLCALGRRDEEGKKEREREGGEEGSKMNVSAIIS